MNPARPSPPRRASPLNHEPKSPFPPMLLLVRCLATVAREVTLKAAWPLWAPCSYVPSGLCVMVYSLCADFIANSPISLKSALLWIWWSACLHSPLLVLLASCPVPSQTLSTQVIQTWLKGFNNLKKTFILIFFILSIKHSRVQTHVLKHLHVWFTAGSHPMPQVGMELTICLNCLGTQNNPASAFWVWELQAQATAPGLSPRFWPHCLQASGQAALLTDMCHLHHYCMALSHLSFSPRATACRYHHSPPTPSDVEAEKHGCQRSKSQNILPSFRLFKE